MLNSLCKPKIKSALNTTSIRQCFEVRYDYEVFFTCGALNPNNPVLAELIAKAERDVQVLPIIDDSVLHHFPGLPEKLENYFDIYGVKSNPFISIPGGECCKSTPEHVDLIVNRIYEYAVDRHSFVLAIGGGAALDMIGYATAIAHRGIRLIRMPTTVLAQNDAGIGVKNAINFQDRKNFIGTFAPPFGVINDFEFLQTLQKRDLRSGIAETIKVALLKDSRLFYSIKRELENASSLKAEDLHNVIKEGARLHLEHIRCSGDPFEMGSARPLDFGHWSAHYLEQLSGYRLRHGEAVAIGIALDCIYTRKIGLMTEAELRDILQLFRKLGFPLDKESLSKLNIVEALNEFKEHLGGRLSITLLERIGQPFEANSIDIKNMQDALVDLINIEDWESL